jgi:hypothetical protein
LPNGRPDPIARPFFRQRVIDLGLRTRDRPRVIAAAVGLTLLALLFKGALRLLEIMWLAFSAVCLWLLMALAAGASKVLRKIAGGTIFA